MASLLVHVTVVPGTTVISAGMKVLWSMVTVATGAAPALFPSCATQGVAASGVNRAAANFQARKMSRGLRLSTLGRVFGFATKWLGSRTVKIGLLACRLSPETHRRVMKFPNAEDIFSTIETAVCG